MREAKQVHKPIPKYLEKLEPKQKGLLVRTSEIGNILSSSLLICCSTDSQASLTFNINWHDKLSLPNPACFTQKQKPAQKII